MHRVLNATCRRAIRLDSWGLGSVGREHKGGVPGIMGNGVSAHQVCGRSVITGGMLNGVATLKDSLAVSYKTKHSLAI